MPSETQTEALAAPVERAWWRRTMPLVHGRELSHEEAVALYVFLVGKPFRDWSRRIEESTDKSEQVALRREAADQDARARDACSAFCALIAYMFSLPPELIELKLSDGKTADSASISFVDVHTALRSFGGAFEGRPIPRLCA